MVIFYLKNNSKKTLRKIWSGIGKCINFATAKEETGHAPGNFFVKFIEGIEEASVVQERREKEVNSVR